MSIKVITETEQYIKKCVPIESKIISTDNVLYDQDDIKYDTTTVVPKNTILTIALDKIVQFFKVVIDDIKQQLNITNVGTGVKVYAGNTLLGNKKLRTLTSSDDSVSIQELEDEIDITVLSDGGGGNQDLQSVLDNGNTTNKDFYHLENYGVSVLKTGIIESPQPLPFKLNGVEVNIDGAVNKLGFSIGEGCFISSYINESPSSDHNLGFVFPINKPNPNYPSIDTYTLATTDDIPSYTPPGLEQVLAQGNSVLNRSIHIIGYDSSTLSDSSLEIQNLPSESNSRFKTRLSTTGLELSNLNSGDSAYLTNGGLGVYVLPTKTMALYTLATTDDIKLKEYTVATLPAGTKGDVAFVNDALSPTFLAPVVGGGSVVVRVFHNGTTWIVQ